MIVAALAASRLSLMLLIYFVSSWLHGLESPWRYQLSDCQHGIASSIHRMAQTLLELFAEEIDAKIVSCFVSPAQHDANPGFRIIPTRNRSLIHIREYRCAGCRSAHSRVDAVGARH